MIGMVESRTERDGKTEQERRCRLCSTKPDAETFARVVRSRWGIKNRLHWMLDAVFHDGLACLRTGHGPANMAAVKHMCQTHGTQPAQTGQANRQPEEPQKTGRMQYRLSRSRHPAGHLIVHSIVLRAHGHAGPGADPACRLRKRNHSRPKR